MSQDPEKSETQKAVMWNQGDDDQANLNAIKI